MKYTLVEKNSKKSDLCLRRLRKRLMALSFSPSTLPILIGISAEEEGVSTHTSIQGTPHRLLSLVNEDWSLSELIIRNKIRGRTKVVDDETLV